MDRPGSDAARGDPGADHGSDDPPEILDSEQPDRGDRGPVKARVERTTRVLPPEKLLEWRPYVEKSLESHRWLLTAEDYLDQIPQNAVRDFYGEGGVVEELENVVADQLGKPAAVFLPTGTMAQQIALRVHADRLGRRTVLWHPSCHLANSEGDGYQRLHGLHGKAVGESSRLVTLNDLKEGASELAEPPAALLLELPQRDLGGQLPTWHDLTAQVDWARSKGAAVHMDGARLWGCESFYRRSVKEISQLFDTVYVSFYKQLLGLPGAALAGPKDVVAEVREWRRPHGGTQAGLFLNAASDLHCLRTRFPRIPDYQKQALQIADAVRGLPGVEVVPDPPHTPMMHFFLRRQAEPLREAALHLARTEGIWTFGYFTSTDSPQVQRAELEVGEAALEFTAKEVREVFKHLLED